MNASTFIAKRYFFSKKSINAINIISGISMVGVLVASGALFIILSVFNGLEELVLGMYSSFTAELRIEPKVGKGFDGNQVVFNQIKQDKRIANYSNVLQEKVLLQYGDYQHIATMKGVDVDYGTSRNMDSLLWDGAFYLEKNQQDFAVIGAGVYANLGVSLNEITRNIQVFSPKKGVVNSFSPAEEFTERRIAASAVLKSQQQLDELIFVPITFAREVLGEYKEVSAVEINAKPQVNIETLKADIKQKLGEGFLIKTQVEQNPELYKLLNTEKWGVFFILAFVLVIAAFNIVGSLTMLVIDKQKDIAVLNSLGASKGLIKKIFFYEGMLISLLGSIIGLGLGMIFCLLQQRFGLIRMGSNNLITDVYPVSMQGSDFLLVFFTVIVVSGTASMISAKLSVRNMEQLKEAT